MFGELGGLNAYLFVPLSIKCLDVCAHICARTLGGLKRTLDRLNWSYKWGAGYQTWILCKSIMYA